MPHALQQVKAMSFYIWTAVAFVITMVATVIYLRSTSRVALWVVLVLPVVYLLGYWLGSLHFKRRARIHER